MNTLNNITGSINPLLKIMLFCLTTVSLQGQSIVCNKCAPIANQNYVYSIDGSDPIWVAVKKQINCVPTPIFGLTDLQVRDVDVFEDDYSDTQTNYTAYQPFTQFLSNLNGATNINAQTVKNLAAKLREAVAYHINGNGAVQPDNPNYRYIKCIEIQSINYVFCVSGCTGVMHFDLVVKHGKKAIISNE